mmetsp:Transcript_7872/g.19537  ORF Transcript_7872/g.19537 Transcript_7872/m.19537 type:complete len:204 (+) Transcript_7872:363-974(+)
MHPVLRWIRHEPESCRLVHHDHGARHEGFPHAKVALPVGRVARHDNLGVPQVAQVVHSEAVADAKIVHLADEGRITIVVLRGVLAALAPLLLFAGFSHQLCRKLVGPFDDPVAGLVGAVFAMPQDIRNGPFPILKGNEEVLVSIVLEVAVLGLLVVALGHEHLAVHLPVVGTFDLKIHVRPFAIHRNHHHLRTAIRVGTHVPS